MKYLTTKIGLIGLLLTTIFISPSCKTNSISIKALRPADITIENHIQHVALALRIKPAKENKVQNVVEGLLTGESLFADREAAPEAISGLRDALISTPRFTCTTVPGELLGTGGSFLPPALSWDDVKRICEQNKADALITLELFDSDQATNFTEGTRKVKNKEGVETSVPEFSAQLRINVTCGWRIYDPKNMRIIDEARAVDTKEFGGKGDTRLAAERALPNNRIAIKETGFFAGHQYGSRISPSWIRLNRFYYVKGSGNFELGRRCVQTDNWDGAAEAWKREIGNADKKIAGRAAHNLAVACEVQGKLDLAIEWASKAYVTYGNQQSLYYSNQLKARKRDEERLAEQLQTPKQ